MAVFQTLYSGSSGNCSMLRDGGSTVLVDMGKSCKITLNALKDLGVPISSIDGILITHEHSDHVSGLMTFLKHYDVPLYSDAKTLGRLRATDLIPDKTRIVPVHEREQFRIGEMMVESFRTDHDSVACVGYRFTFSDGSRAAVATDLGRVTDSVFDALSDCSLVALEANYDDAMLQMGPYPMYLKERIASDNGHLSNLDCAETLVKLAKTADRDFVLMHLSQENNTPEIALTTCLGMLENYGITRSTVIAAPRHTIGEKINIRVG